MKPALIHFIIVSLFLISCSSEKKSDTRTKKYQKKDLNALQIILKNDCLHCHSLEDKVVGPPYLDIARRYKDQPEIKNTLANKIREGGGGLWYGGMMSGHPLLKKSEVNKIVTWILSLNERHSKFNQELIGINLNEVLKAGASTENNDDILVEVYELDNPVSSFANLDESIKPNYSANIKQICLVEDEAFDSIKPPYLLKFSGKLKTSTKGKYFFRLQKTGPGQAFLDGKSIISNTENDTEIALDIEPGIHPFEVYSSVVSKNELLAFSWIEPGKEYYSLIGSD